MDGDATVAGERVGEGHLALLRRDGDSIHLKNDSARPIRALLGGGEPINEPFKSYGPFVMDNEADLRESVEMYQAGRLGRVANPTYDRVRIR